jgi:hypothetical protein
MALDAVTRPIHPKADPAAHKAFENFAGMIDEIQGKHPKATALEVWVQDGNGTQGSHVRVGEKGTLTRRWAARGSRPQAIRDHWFKLAYLFGVICPDRDTGVAIVLSRAYPRPWTSCSPN